MRTALLSLFLWASAAAQDAGVPGADEVPPAGSGRAADMRVEDPARPLYNVELLDADGVKTEIAGFYRVSGEGRYLGYRGRTRVEIPYDRVRQISIEPARHPGDRMRARFLLRTGDEVETTFDAREGDALFAGYARFGRARVFFREIRVLKFLGETSLDDLPEYGAAGAGVDARIRDRQGLTTEVAAFRRSTGENVLPGVRGRTSVEIPLRVLAGFRQGRDGEPSVAVLRDGTRIELEIPVYEEDAVLYRGEAAFGLVHVRLGDLRSLEVHRVTPVLRDLDPAAAAGLPAEEAATSN